MPSGKSRGEPGRGLAAVGLMQLVRATLRRRADPHQQIWNSPAASPCAKAGGRVGSGRRRELFYSQEEGKKSRGFNNLLILFTGCSQRDDYFHKQPVADTDL
jgi:hypothetical protein